MSRAGAVVDVAVVPNARRARRGARSSRWRRRTLIRLGQAGVILAVLAVWVLANQLQLLNEDVLPPVAAVAFETVSILVSPEFWASMGYTLVTALASLVISLVVGVPIGLLLGVSRPVRHATQILLDFGRSFPVIALLPLMALLLGTNQIMEITVVSMALVWAVIVQAIDGSRRLDPVISDTVRSFGVGRSLRFWKVVLPNAAPYLVTGVRIAATAALLVSIAIELLTQLPGLGGQISRAQQYQAPALALAYVVYAGVVAMILNAVLWRGESRFLAWSRRAVTS